MSLGTNHKRNSDRNEQRINLNIANAKQLATTLCNDLHLNMNIALDEAAKIILKRTTIEKVYEHYKA